VPHSLEVPDPDLAGVLAVAAVENGLRQNLAVNAIPVETMKEVMKRYGPETFEQRRATAPATDASIRRRFARFFPDFFLFFFYFPQTGTYHPYLGEFGEKQRRAVRRQLAKKTRKEVNQIPNERCIT
jgi:hypothetical protein